MFAERTKLLSSFMTQSVHFLEQTLEFML